LTDNSFESDEQTYQSNVRTALAFIRTIDAQKRTHLAELRTGIGILTIPMSLLTILIATSNYYSITEVISFISALVLDEYLRSSYDFASLVVDFNNHNQE
jgi:uncharacterized membrane protein YidH (DUF202 family)